MATSHNVTTKCISIDELAVTPPLHWSWSYILPPGRCACLCRYGSIIWMENFNLEEIWVCMAILNHSLPSFSWHWIASLTTAHNLSRFWKKKRKMHKWSEHNTTKTVKRDGFIFVHETICPYNPYKKTKETDRILCHWQVERCRHFNSKLVTPSVRILCRWQMGWRRHFNSKLLT